jgi:phenylpropionate dioxygenase-like ring-hydroxylating dioxygenase large terminal subunit
LTKKMIGRVAQIFEEDRQAIEAVQEVMNRKPGRPYVNLRIDAGNVAARRIVERKLAEERLAAPQAAE